MNIELFILIIIGGAAGGLSTLYLFCASLARSDLRFTEK